MDLLTVDETARMLRVHPETIRRYITSGRLPAVRVGRRIRIDRRAVDTFAQPVAARASAEAMPGSLEKLSRNQIAEARALIHPMTKEERKRALEAIEELRKFREGLFAERAGRLFPESWPMIREAREERDRQLWGAGGGEDEP